MIPELVVHSIKNQNWKRKDVPDYFNKRYSLVDHRNVRLKLLGSTILYFECLEEGDKYVLRDPTNTSAYNHTNAHVFIFSKSGMCLVDAKTDHLLACMFSAYETYTCYTIFLAEKRESGGFKVLDKFSDGTGKRYHLAAVGTRSGGVLLVNAMNIEEFADWPNGHGIGSAIVSICCTKSSKLVATTKSGVAIIFDLFTMMPLNSFQVSNRSITSMGNMSEEEEFWCVSESKLIWFNLLGEYKLLKTLDHRIKVAALTDGSFILGDIRGKSLVYRLKTQKSTGINLNIRSIHVLEPNVLLVGLTNDELTTFVVVKQGVQRLNTAKTKVGAIAKVYGVHDVLEVVTNKEYLVILSGDSLWKAAKKKRGQSTKSHSGFPSVPSQVPSDPGSDLSLLGL